MISACVPVITGEVRMLQPTQFQLTEVVQPIAPVPEL